MEAEESEGGRRVTPLLLQQDAGSEAAREGPTTFHRSTGTDTVTQEKDGENQILLKSPLSPLGVTVPSSVNAKGQRGHCVALCVHHIWIRFY